jgi:NADH-quinone oxidoreductase subunit L
MTHSNEMKDMGGLRKLMPITHATFLIACLAIAGIPPFAGFFSKEEVLYAAFNSNKIMYSIALITSGITSFYMFRLYFSIFWNKEAPVHDHHGEGTVSMKIPLIILSAGAVLAGFIPFGEFVSTDGTALESVADIKFSFAPVLLGVTGILLAMKMYKTQNALPEKISSSVNGIYKSAYNKFYIDEIYLFFTKKIVFNLIGKPAAWIDKNIVDGTMYMIASLTEIFSDTIRGFQSGKVQNYAIYFFAGVIGFAVLFIYLWN